MATQPQTIQQQAACTQIQQWKAERQNLLNDIDRKLARVSIIDKQLAVLWSAAGVECETLPVAPTPIERPLVQPVAPVPSTPATATAVAVPAPPSSVAVSGTPAPVPAAAPVPAPTAVTPAK